ncbi:hypothetical protein SELR_pSRC400330 (plasmid) [Selenomonas ruminantium subsp. lactilytica TAM6421]|uniref:Uncharacterized protein n=1 Tax=Selenomonas ruminantium subsp. lactilytica (strain NBRC 103574 / TAM6421) TaxID=927704 RepID=I0GV97_SELRL|nr:hypothetical protein [Selenomonas ruminantium]BAL84684.1 hypothetical protein SELR_pSRC400330 [Selenomonas ruminantium subsp. lactilytica TAM6421]
MLSRRELFGKIYQELWKDADLAKLLGNPKTPQERSERIRMGITPLSYATADKVNFISMYLSSTTETENIYAVRAFLNVDYYGKSYSDLLQMSEIVGRVMERLGILCDSSYDVASNTKGVYIYTQKYRPIIWSQ